MEVRSEEFSDEVAGGIFQYLDGWDREGSHILKGRDEHVA